MSIKKELSLVLFFLFARLDATVYAQQPNIIVFMVDDMGWQDCSVPFWTRDTTGRAGYQFKRQ